MIRSRTPAPQTILATASASPSVGGGAGHIGSHIAQVAHSFSFVRLFLFSLYSISVKTNERWALSVELMRPCPPPPPFSHKSLFPATYAIQYTQNALRWQQTTQYKWIFKILIHIYRALFISEYHRKLFAKERAKGRRNVRRLRRHQLCAWNASKMRPTKLK